MSETISVVWLCEIANLQIYSHLKFASWRLKNIIRFLKGKSVLKVRNLAQWNTNAIKEFEKFKDIKLTVIFSAVGIRNSYQKFSINGIDYICYRPEDDYLVTTIQKRIMKLGNNYIRTRKIVSSLIDEIKPDIVHVIGAENPYYSICALDVPANIPCVVSLQTLMSEPSFKGNYPINEDSYQYRTSIEQQVIKRSNYIASGVKPFYDFITENIKKDSIFLQMTLAVGVDVNIEPSKKEYDFIYFANNINKAADYAIEVFAIACQKYPSLTLNISGRYEEKFKSTLEKRMKELGIEKNVFITGSKQTHEEVIEQIKKSRFALIPLKVDFVSGTIREAMACGLPVVTTITQGTPILNNKRESVLLSPIGDYQAMADNILKIVENENLAKSIRDNALITVKEMYSNEAFMKKWRKAYFQIIENFHNKTPFSDDVLYIGSDC